MNATRRLERAIKLDQEIQKLEIALRDIRADARHELACAKANAQRQPFTDTEIELLIARLEHPEHYVDAVDDAIEALRALLPISVHRSARAAAGL